jgi:putative spermidine/putrescine transport system ATP-binding protein
VGDNNSLRGQATADGALQLADGRTLRTRGLGATPAGAAQLCVRPERLHLGAEGPNQLAATVLDAIHQGDHWRVVARLQGLDATWFAKLAPRALPQGLSAGQSITLSFGHDDAWLFPA